VRGAFAPWGSEEALSLGRGERHRYASYIEREDGVENHMSLRSIGAAWSESDGRQGARSAPPPGPSMPKGAKRRSTEPREAHAITASHVKGRPVIFRGGSQGGLRRWPRLTEGSRPASAAHQRATPSSLRDGAPASSWKSLPGGSQARAASSLSSSLHFPPPTRP